MGHNLAALLRRFLELFYSEVEDRTVPRESALDFETLDTVSPRENPRGPKDAPYKIYRGGSWGDVDERLLSVFYRNFTDPATRTSTIGFRCASDP